MWVCVCIGIVGSILALIYLFPSQLLAFDTALLLQEHDLSFKGECDTSLHFSLNNTPFRRMLF